MIVFPLQVQSDHFEEFFSPELDKHGYQALFKRKTAEVYNGSSQTIDGCATFFRRDRFSHVKKYEVCRLPNLINCALVLNLLMEHKIAACTG